MNRHNWCARWSLALLACAYASAAGAEEQANGGDDAGIRAPAGFEVSLYAGDELAHDIFSMTVDSHGRVVVAGLGYVKTLHDDDGDGKADRATQFSDRPKSGAHGMLFLGNDLLCTGDDSLMLLRDRDGDGVADGEPEVWAKVRHPEHGANGLTRGPDGWIYSICGNDAGVSSTLASTEGSPVKQPQCGAVVRFSPDGKQSEIVAHGFRNPYDLDFNADGQLFTVDADGERDHHLPWYAPTRLFDIAQGMHHGWVLQGWQRSWNRPEWMFDNVPRLAEIGRGSPTGLLVYRHTQFPEHYRGSVLSCCWTLGRVYCLPLTSKGSSYSTASEVFLETTGEVGFAPVDIAVGRSGELFVAIGGRRTRGSVFRVTHSSESAKGEPPSPDSLESVLRAPQPQAAWSRVNWEAQAKQLGSERFSEACLDEKRPAEERIRAIEVLTDLYDGPSPDTVSTLVQGAESDGGESASSRVAARAVWALGRRNNSPAAREALAGATKSQSLSVQRAAWEALAASSRTDRGSDGAPLAAAWDAGLNSEDRRVRAAALSADARHSPAPEAPKTETYLWRLHFRGELTQDHFVVAAEAFLDADDDRTRLNCVRLMELALGDIDTHQMQADVYAGYSLNASTETIAAARERFGERVSTGFPAADENLNREWARLLGMLAVDSSELVEKLSERLTADSAPNDDIHYLIVLSRLPGERTAGATSNTASALARLHSKMKEREWYPSRNWPLRLSEAVRNLYRYDSKLAPQLIEHADFARPVQAMFADGMQSSDRSAAARKLMRSPPDPDDEATRWTEELVQLIADLPNEEALPALREAWDDFTLRDSIVAVLARARQPEDRERYIEMLGSLQPRSVELSAAALTMLSHSPTEADIAAAIAALKQACSTPEQRGTRQALAHLLAHWSGKTPTIDESSAANALAAYQPWFEWFAAEHPEAAARLGGLAGDDGLSWQRRLEQIDWDAGDADQGKLVFEKRNCVRCHAGSSPLGPDLSGAAGRFSRGDLLIAIVDPHKDVSPLYQTTQIVTGSGRIFNGLVVYESPDSTLLQTAPDTTTRITGDEIVLMRKTKTSLMPTGLLNGITDDELSDLFAYLKTLKPKR